MSIMNALSDVLIRISFSRGNLARVISRRSLRGKKDLCFGGKTGPRVRFAPVELAMLLTRTQSSMHLLCKGNVFGSNTQWPVFF